MTDQDRSGQQSQKKKRVPLVDDLFTVPATAGEKPHLIGSKCSACGEYFFPKRAICAHCQKENLQEILFGQTGELYSFTLVRIPPFGHKGPLPYAQGQIQLPEGPLVGTILTDCDFQKLQNGMAMEITLVKLEEDDLGNDVMSYMYRPTAEDVREGKGA